MVKIYVDPPQANHVYAIAKMPPVYVHHDPNPTMGQPLLDVRFLVELYTNLKRELMKPLMDL